MAVQDVKFCELGAVVPAAGAESSAKPRENRRILIGIAISPSGERPRAQQSGRSYAYAFAHVHWHQLRLHLR